jgi:hypothetical protein
LVVNPPKEIPSKDTAEFGFEMPFNGMERKAKFLPGGFSFEVRVIAINHDTKVVSQL